MKRVLNSISRARASAISSSSSSAVAVAQPVVSAERAKIVSNLAAYQVELVAGTARFEDAHGDARVRPVDRKITPIGGKGARTFSVAYASSGDGSALLSIHRT